MTRRDVPAAGAFGHRQAGEQLEEAGPGLPRPRGSQGRELLPEGFQSDSAELQRQCRALSPGNGFGRFAAFLSEQLAFLS